MKQRTGGFPDYGNSKTGLFKADLSVGSYSAVVYIETDLDRDPEKIKVSNKVKDKIAETLRRKSPGFTPSDLCHITINNIEESSSGNTQGIIVKASSI